MFSEKVAQVLHQPQRDEPPTFITTCDLVNEVCEYLTIDDILSVGTVKKAWNLFLRGRTEDRIPLGVLVKKQEELREWVKNNAFGARLWEQFDWQVEKVPLPLKEWDILNEPCPFHPSMTIKETHILFLLPSKINDQTLTVDDSLKILKKDIVETATQYYDSSVQKECGNNINTKSSWVLMLKDLLPKSKGESFEKQCSLIPQDSPTRNYEVSNLLTLIVGIRTHYLHTKVTLYSNDPPTYTHCSETIGNQKWRIIVGGFDGSNLPVFHNWNSNHETYGLTISRKFPVPESKKA